MVQIAKRAKGIGSSSLVCCNSLFRGLTCSVVALLLIMSTVSVYRTTILSVIVAATATRQSSAAEKQAKDSGGRPHVVVVQNHLMTTEYLSIKKFSGDGWELWDRKTVLFNDTNTTSCLWVTFKGHQEIYQPPVPPGLEIPMCVHNGNDAVSITIKKRQKWVDCEKLLIWWASSKEVTGIHLEVGANIGACLLDVLLGTNATIAAFEPNPTNLFALTSTLSRLDKAYRDRVYLFPVGLGQKTESNVIYTAIGNAGNSVVGKVVKDHGRQRFAAPLPIHIERLDDLLDAEHTRVNVMKLDAQGYECFILDGMPQVIYKVRRIGFEFADRWQSAFPNCSAKLLVDRLRSHDMSIHQTNGSLVEGDIIIQQDFDDFVAVRNINQNE